MAVKEYTFKVDKLEKRMGLHETFVPKSLGKYGDGFTVTMLLTIKGGKVYMPEPLFYFAEQFVPVAEKVKEPSDLTGYIRAHKPIFSHVGKNTPYLKISGFYNPDGGVTTFVDTIKFRKQLKGDGLTVTGYSSPAHDSLKRQVHALVKDLFRHLKLGDNGISREDFYRWRLGFTEPGQGELVDEALITGTQGNNQGTTE